MDATLQLAAPPEMRGRVIALWEVAFLGSTAIGGPIVGGTAWLRDVIRGAQAHALNCRFHFVDAGNHDHQNVWVLTRQLLEELLTRHVRHSEIQNDHAVLCRGKVR